MDTSEIEVLTFSCSTIAIIMSFVWRPVRLLLLMLFDKCKFSDSREIGHVVVRSDVDIVDVFDTAGVIVRGKTSATANIG